MRSLFKWSFLIFAPILAIFSSTSVSSKVAADCTDYEFIFARGSGQSLEDEDFKAFKTAFKNKLDNYSTNFYELGNKNNDDSYPAVEVSGFKAISVFLSAGKSYEFRTSVEKGVKELRSHLESESKRCKDKQFILAGYSQGAMIISYALPSVDANKILYVATFGDPKLYLPEGKNPTNTACKNIGLSNYRVYVPDCYVEEGILSALNPYQQPEYRDKLGAFCNQNDFMCGSNFDLSDVMKAHTSYNSENGYQKAAEIILEKIENDQLKDNNNQSASSPKTETTYSSSPPKDIVVLFDYSYFSGTLTDKQGQKSISDDLKAKLVELTNQGARVAVYNVYAAADMFDNYRAMPPLVEMIPFTDVNLAEKIDEFNLENRYQAFRYAFVVSGNNNYYGIKTISKTTAWRERAERHIILVTDTFHHSNFSFDDTSYLNALEAAKSADVRVSLVTTRLQQYIWYGYIMDATGGHVFTVGSFLGDMKLSKNQIVQTKSKLFSKTIELNQKSDYSIIIVNDVVYGYSKGKTLTIINLDSGMENNIEIVGYNSSGERVTKDSYIVPPEDVKIPDCGSASLSF